ncbi:STAS domain-containing protein [Actinocatenispora rupis]|uniref:STAS domain-containing protein n=1 Tax=Actinocatenispora rupis TaxID=519421 RepID=A0A8J3NAV2_9ACTN|nr:STAS domain-containing protein [Actinocatenispora rupis]GID12739.1 hypothetical protein Aru02nite_36280 [Actinocatenispora rupis]
MTEVMDPRDRSDPAVPMPGWLPVTPTVHIEHVRGIGFRQLSAVGELTGDAVSELRRTLSSLLTLYPRVVLDCGRLRVARPALLSVFCTAHERAGGWPLTRLALYGLDEDTAGAYEESGLGERVPHRSAMADAVAALDEPPVVLRRSRLLLPPTAVPDARETVDGCRQDWGLPRDQAVRAALIVAELAVGANEAGAVRSRLAMEWRPGAVGVALTERLAEPVPVGVLTAVALDELAGTWSSGPHRYGRRTIATIPL